MNNIFTKYLRNGLQCNTLFFKKPLLIMQLNKGILACKYIDINIAEKICDKLAVFENVNYFDDILEAKVVNCTSKAKEIGVKEGMTGLEVLEIYNNNK